MLQPLNDASMTPAAGAGLTGTKMARRIGDVDEFEFKAIGEKQNQGVSFRFWQLMFILFLKLCSSCLFLHLSLLSYLVFQRLAVEILIAGFVFEEADFIKPWEGINDNSER